jgi:hypothetical protein
VRKPMGRKICRLLDFKIHPINSYKASLSSITLKSIFPSYLIAKQNNSRVSYRIKIVKQNAWGKLTSFLSSCAMPSA